MSDLLNAQRAFTWFIAKFICKAYDLGFESTLGEAYRPPEMAAIYAEHGKGITYSLHTLRLAMDMNFFEGDAFLKTFDELLPLGDIWEKMSDRGYNLCWGGRFTHQDCDHFSLEYKGIK